ncbi:MAG: flagellar type III secretion system pore protein FliP [Actinomycetia bacterium]|nr:flagellar type III secretion system pore protein FliP [Actinomycetes bacterium]
MSLSAVLAVAAISIVVAVCTASPAAAQEIDIPEPTIPEIPLPGEIGPSSDQLNSDGVISIDIGSPENSASQSVLLIVGLAVLSLAPSLVLMLSSFTRIIIVFSLTRNALGLQGIPPNQVLVSLSLFLTMFVMMPTLNELYDNAVEPYLDGAITQEVAIERGTGPIRTFMLANTETSELELMLDASQQERPESVDDIGLSALIPAFLLSEMKTAFIIGFVIFIPFLVIDIVVAASLMALGMMMLPPVFVSLPFKLLLFIMVGGWSLVVETLLASFA